MGLKRALQWLIRIALIAAIAVSVLVMYFIQQIDQIVNDQLYDYGLVNMPEWYDPFHSTIMILFTCLGAIIILSGLSLVMGLIAYKNKVEIPSEPKQQSSELKEVASIDQEQDDGKMAGTCPHCKKEFTKPIVMLNFEGGKSKLVHVCPHCSHTLGSVEEK